MPEKRTPLYLGRESYRLRRLVDAQRFLPMVVFALFLLPLLWGGAEVGRPVGGGVAAVLHVFVVWLLGIAATIFLSIALKRRGRGQEGEDGTRVDLPDPDDVPPQPPAGPVAPTPASDTAPRTER